MKFLLGQFIHVLTKGKGRNVRMLMKFLLILATMITVYSIRFHYLMVLEDQRFSWINRNISKLHTAGANLVMSSASLAANTILNLLKPDDVLMLAEGLNVFRFGMNAALVGKTLVESQIRMQTGCSVIAIHHDGEMVSNPDPSVRFCEKDELIMIGTDDAENRFLKMYA